MIISDSHKFIFISNPKTGTSTINTHLSSYGWRTPNAYNDGQEHLLPMYAALHFKVGIEKWNTYFKICFTRNPWDRLVSSFLFLNKVHPLWNLPIYSNFEDYLLTAKDVHIHQYNYDGMYQKYYLFDSNGTLIIDFVGRFETLTQDIIELHKQLKLPIPSQKHHTNRHEYAGRKHYTEYYTEQWMIDTVAEREKLVIEMFGYEYGKDGDRWK